MTLWFHPSGPKLSYRRGALYIDDLNPAMRLTWVLRRTELFWIGMRCLWAAVVSGRPKP
jgi:hypothetical protein